MTPPDDGQPTPPPHGGRTRQFTEADILRATVALIEADGVGRLTMRRLGKALGIEAMSIYRYFPSRQDLINALADWVVLETATDPELQFDATDDWRDYLDRLAHGIRRVALTHPRVFPIVATTPTEAPWIRPPMRSLRWVDSFLLGLIEHHFPPAAAVTLYKRFCSFLLGHLLLEVAALGLDDVRDGPAPPPRTDDDRRDAARERRRRAQVAEDVMTGNDAPSAEDIEAAGLDRPPALADEPAVLAAEPSIAAQVEQAGDAVDSIELDADVPIAAAVTATHALDLADYPNVEALAGLLARDTAPDDFERMLDQLLDSFEHLRRP